MMEQLSETHPLTHVVVIVYNRFHNLKHWLDCWRSCDRTGAELVVIHNTDGPQLNYRELCAAEDVLYLERPNVGFDIGALQDVLADRLPGFPAWERLLWMTDDTFPMARDFVRQFNAAMRAGVGVACMEISPYVTTHIRTTGFMLDRALGRRLAFPADPVRTKQDCYLFEHRWKGNVFYDQVKRLGLTSAMVGPRKVSPLWDIGYHRSLDRRAEHEALFGPLIVPDRVLIICPVYRQAPTILVASLLAQTHKNWELRLIHDGPDTENLGPAYADLDPRISFMATPRHGGCWGHYIRQVGIDLYAEGADFVVVTNGDNYHVPVYLEYMLRGFDHKPTAVATYCADMVHSYKAWKVISCRLEQGFLDCAGVMVRGWVAKRVGWADITSHSADWIYFSDIMQLFGAHRFQKVAGCLLIHN